jgi:hypothetical protein
MSRVARDMMEHTVPARGSQLSVLIHTVSWDGDVGTPSGWATLPWPLPAARARVSGVRLVMLLRPLRQALGNVLTYVDRVQPEYQRLWVTRLFTHRRIEWVRVFQSLCS